MQHKLQYNTGVAMQDNAEHRTLVTVQYWGQTQFQVGLLVNLPK